MRAYLAALVASIIWLCALGSAHAQATRTWVSGVGDDANPCSRTQPCNTFAGAFSKTAAGGEIDALDPGEFGALTITKAITIDGHATLGASMQPGSTGISITAGASDAVIVRGLTVHGDGTQNGVQFTSGGPLQIEDCSITGFKEGIAFTPPPGGHLSLLRVSSHDNGDAGLLVHAGAGTTALVTVASSHLDDNAVGLLAGAGALVTVYDSVASGNSGAGVSATLDGTGGTAEINLEGVALNQNAVGAIAAAPAGTAVVRMSQVLATGNSTSPTQTSGNGAILSFGNNRLDVQASLKLSSTAPTQTVRSGQSAKFPLTVAVTGLLASPISFACSGLPAGAGCQFAPMPLPAGMTSSSVTLTVTTTPSAAGLSQEGRDPRVPWAVIALLLLASACLLFSRSARLRRPLRVATAAGSLALLLVAVGCHGGGGSDMTGPADMSTNLMPGTYPFQVTATSGTISTTLPLTLTVQ